MSLIGIEIAIVTIMAVNCCVPSFVVATPLPSTSRWSNSSVTCHVSFKRPVLRSLQQPQCTQHATIRPTASVAAPSTHVVTVIAPNASDLSALYSTVTAKVVDVRASVTVWRSLASNVAEAHIVLDANAEHDLVQSLRRLSDATPADISLQTHGLARAPKKLAIFDLDSTLIQHETIDELAAELNLQPEVAAITARAMNGELDFRTALSERVALLRGLHTSSFDVLKRRVQYTPGAADLTGVLRASGCTTAVVSGGFDFLAEHVRDVLGLDYAFANRLQVDDNACLTGRTVGPIVDAEFKRSTLLSLAEKASLPTESILSVGDGSNDLLMLQCAGLGVAFNAKPVVQKQAKYRVNQPSLRNVVYLLGYTDYDIQRLLDEGAPP